MASEQPALISLHALERLRLLRRIDRGNAGGRVNRPGLSAISYRVGTHCAFKTYDAAALFAAPSFPALKDLRTRADDDFTIALLDAAAMVADVLTFYQERLANESFLRTATERRSVLELARLIGYELRPGVAASTELAFTLEETPGAPREPSSTSVRECRAFPVPARSRRPSRPSRRSTRGSNGTRSTRWRAINVPTVRRPSAYLKGIATNLKPGDAILLVGKERENDPGSERLGFSPLSEVNADAEANRTRIEWSEGLGTTSPHKVLPAVEPKIYALRQRAALFGASAPHPATLSDQTLGHYA